MSGPLEDIRVIDCGVFQAGPTTGVILGDLGADVIKMEPCISGDPGRGIEIYARAPSQIRHSNDLKNERVQFKIVKIQGETP